MERFAPGLPRPHPGAARRTRRPQMEAHDANYVGGDINGGIQDIRQLIFRPWPTLDPYHARDPGPVPVLVVHAAGRRRPRHERDCSRPSRRYATTCADAPSSGRRRASSRRSQTPRNRAPIAGTAVHIDEQRAIRTVTTDLDVGEAVLDDAALQAVRHDAELDRRARRATPRSSASVSWLSASEPATASSRWSRPSMPVAIWPIRSAARDERLGTEDVDRPELVLEVVELRL